ncbi:MAG: helix-turn-helix domain-containing protein [Oscillospiraceae bacterium]|nr:helix-turn-helix domain-containing protein [Oscillospiraceae bacterium]
MDKKTIGNFLAALRKTHGLTQQEVADKLNVSNKTVSKWERDESAPDLGLIPVIAEIYGVTCDEILLGERRADGEWPQGKSAKIGKQTRRLAANTAVSFRNMALLAVLIAVVGYIVLLSVSYAFVMPGLGFGLCMAFLAAGAAVLVMQLYNTLRRLDTGDDGELDTAVLDKARAGIWGIVFGTVMVLIFIVLIALPLSVGSKTYLDTFELQMGWDHIDFQVIPWNQYLSFFPPMMLVCFALALPVYLLLRRKLRGLWLFSPVENGLKMSFYQAILIGCSVIFPYQKKSFIGDYAVTLFFVSLTLAAAVSVLYAVKTKGCRALLLAMGGRNLLLVFAVSGLVEFISRIRLFGSLYLGHRNDMNDTIWRYAQYGYHEFRYIPVFTAAVLFGYAAVKRKYIKKMELKENANV